MENYEKARLVLMCRDPEWLYAYWEVSSKDRINLLEAFKEAYLKNATWALCILSLEPENSSSKGFFIPLAYKERSKYIYLSSESRRYGAQYGLLGQDYSFHPLLFSNTISLPRKKPLLPGGPAYVMERMNPTMDTSSNTQLTSSAESYYVKG